MPKRSSSSRRLKESLSGVDGLPMTLVITMIVLAITVPLVFGSLRIYDRSRTETNLQAEIDSFISMVQMVYTSGPGNSVQINFNAANGGLTTIDSVMFGDVPGGAMASVIRYTIQGRQEAMVLIESPNVPMLSMDNSTFLISSGSYTIIVECESGQYDLNGDGFYSDTYVCLSLA
ncbi:MAG: hypothetical protein Q7J68_03100 [Thermoplasmata archaeon]|nr:hypothetical protein [Thermoplasmata archaeon]